jgi:hypothetical protein
MRTAGTELAGIPDAIRELEAELAAGAIRIVARIAESDRVRDVAIAISPTRLAILRYVDRACVQDRTALATMISQGDFVWGAVIYNQGEALSPPSLVESFHVSQLDQLVARLNELREAFSEAG